MRSLRSLVRRLFSLFRGKKDLPEETVLIGASAPSCPIYEIPPIPREQKKDRSLEPALDRARRILAEIDEEIPIKSVEEHAREEWLPKSRARRRRIPHRPHRRPGSSITSEDIGKHMHGKGRHQTPEYRRSVKAGIQPEDD